MHTTTGMHSWNHLLYRKSLKSVRYIYIQNLQSGWGDGGGGSSQSTLAGIECHDNQLMNIKTINRGEIMNNAMEKAKIDYLVSHLLFYLFIYFLTKCTTTQRKLCDSQLIGRQKQLLYG